MKSVLATVVMSGLVLTSCSSANQQSAKESIAQLNEACAKVRDLNEQVQALNLDDKGKAALDDPETKKLLEDASKAAGDLAEQLDSQAKSDGGKLGELRRKYEDNKELIGEVADFAADESKDSAQDKARRLKRVADLVGADNCAGTEPAA